MNDEQGKQYRAVKQNLSSIQLVIKKDLKEGRVPRQEDIYQFIAISEEMDSLSAPEWGESMAEYMVVLEAFKKAVTYRDSDLLMEKFQKLMDSKVACHKKFR
ncbi:MAG: hypothetical protein CSA26_09895 [Desulfobacterales bacterium]|nr:MAG: hypothetical protein CSA26_09895 [Desulfobacterales bacterium]